MYKCVVQSPTDEPMQKAVITVLTLFQFTIVEHFTCMSQRAARSFSDVATSGCSGPRTFSRMDKDRSSNGSASSYLPCVQPRRTRGRAAMKFHRLTAAVRINSDTIHRNTLIHTHGKDCNELDSHLGGLDCNSVFAFPPAHRV